MLVRLLGEADATKSRSGVISLMSGGSLEPRIVAMGLPCFALGMRRGVLSPSALVELRRIVRDLNPRLLFGWMYHGNLAALLAAKLSASRPPVIWNIRHTPDTLAEQKPLTQATIRLGARLSRRPQRIVYNSRVSLRRHQGLGFAADRAVVIPNGFDVNLFRSQPEAYGEVRKELGVSATTRLVGIVAHFSPMKDYDNFAAAAASVRAEIPDVEFVMCGMNVTHGNRELLNILGRHGLSHGIHALGERADVARLMAAMDVVVSSSAWGEGFQNAIGEALACEVPCVVTDVGDAAHVVGEAGVVVPPRNSLALARGIASILTLGGAERKALGAAGRSRVQRLFALPAIARQYAALQQEVMDL